MRYAKLINSYPQYAPHRLHIGNAVVFNPTDEMLIDAGYLPVIESEPPEPTEGCYYEPVYEEVDGQIVQSWVAVEIPTTDEIMTEEALDIILGGVTT